MIKKKMWYFRVKTILVESLGVEYLKCKILTLNGPFLVMPVVY